MGGYVVVDLEMCKVPKANRMGKYRWSQETIQIGAVMLDEDYNIIEQFDTFVRPEYGQIDTFITKLTGIKKTDVKDAPKMGEAVRLFAEWIGDRDVKMVSWSETDKHQFEHEIGSKGLPSYGIDKFFEEWIDCQKIFGNKINAPKNYNLEEALIASDIIQKGKAHDGLSDAYNTGLLYAKLIKFPDYELNEVYKKAREDRDSHLAFSLGDLMKGIKLD